ncbi:hypothetical protein HETIRDRAFT_426291 [Heterobasidion irregulare TC 32-1]|uniref:Uncharacterized protein n=1 Tax=Heterobasidion irregulare (strain TC 32-1) TaxID=747525 RepID=W4KBL1_HETIT|nr:uncharacterized protein HETIRDRAFT_426291 [Heterobasidion irregulare TC 32-1]ETW82735.1 hypothetical protein HETIRDRAFT_426291 [Heterobasidion irregulare TC 32-1]
MYCRRSSASLDRKTACVCSGWLGFREKSLPLLSLPIDRSEGQCPVNEKAEGKPFPFSVGGKKTEGEAESAKASMERGVAGEIGDGSVGEIPSFVVDEEETTLALTDASAYALGRLPRCGRRLATTTFYKRGEDGPIADACRAEAHRQLGGGGEQRESRASTTLRCLLARKWEEALPRLGERESVHSGVG